jgi:hypothetical protein
MRTLSLVVMSIAALASVARADSIVDYGFYPVPGVVNTLQLTTVFQCTNATAFAVHFDISVFAANGLLWGDSNDFPIPSGETRTISTQPMTGHVTSDLALGSNADFQGVARIQTVKGVVCAAYVMGPGSTPNYLNNLPVIYKLKQK